MADEKMLPCPFCCGDQPWVETTYLNAAECYAVFCGEADACGAGGPMRDSRAAAIAAWNKREAPR